MIDWGAVIDATWPAAQTQAVGPWVIRHGAGGGNRVSAATASAPVTADDLAMAETAMRDLGQEIVFALRPGDDAVDQVLAQAGYIRCDETIIYACPIRLLTAPKPPPVTAFTVWPPLAVQRDIWADGGIGAARLAVMDRAAGPKTTILGRIDDRPAATLFVALHDAVAMLHALDVAVAHRRKGLAATLTRAAAIWADGQGAQTFSLLATVANTGANALYQGLGMAQVGRYHYRAKPKDAT
ncbi:GNAT family N-acetyltransferase [Loktanella sp. SALINAS62]|uniref:GNAT family N-acetyltransferase n=1 Tax=Loktanella sp. SALINAS62 TaxID=2706124 RepID=UPI001B8D5503|nr:GNAT family N-acetyltransferase [Loktanella sp. SALINAS62]MBS1302119.1 GNAT family N-acetyltransferase [Loktanella sp. SALINAS62]